MTGVARLLRARHERTRDSRCRQDMNSPSACLGMMPNALQNNGIDIAAADEKLPWSDLFLPGQRLISPSGRSIQILSP
jgi:hypothetical protein